MKILAIDTSTEACSAALLVDSSSLDQCQIAPQQHSELILKMVDDLLQQADIAVTELNAIAFGRGPGSFVGVRIAAGVAQGIAYAAQLPVIPISSLAAMAQGYREGNFSYANSESLSNESILVAIDARMQQVYWAEYKRDDSDLVELVGQEVVQAPNLVTVSGAKQTLPEPHSVEAVYYGIGTGWGSYAEELAGRFNPRQINNEVYPHAKDILTLAKREYGRANMLPAREAIPVYLRNQVVKKPANASNKQCK